MATETKEKLVLEIEVPDYNVEGLQEEADAHCDGDVGIVLEELIRPEVALGLLDGERESVHPKLGLIRGARIEKPDA